MHLCCPCVIRRRPCVAPRIAQRGTGGVAGVVGRGAPASPVPARVTLSGQGIAQEIVVIVRETLKLFFFLFTVTRLGATALHLFGNQNSLALNPPLPTLY